MDRESKHAEALNLIRQGDAARAHLTGHAHTLKHRLDFPQRVRDSLKTHPTNWLVGSLISGFAVSMMLRRKKPEVRQTILAPEKSRSLPLSLLALTLTAVRPLAKVWIADQLKNYVGSRFTPAPAPLSRAEDRHSQSPHSNSL